MKPHGITGLERVKDLQRFCTITFKGGASYLVSQHNVRVIAVTRRGSCNQKHVPQINCSSCKTYFVVSLYTNLALNLINTNGILVPVYPTKPTRNVFINIHYLSLSLLLWICPLGKACVPLPRFYFFIRLENCTFPFLVYFSSSLRE
jgi:hypothetical protein